MSEVRLMIIHMILPASLIINHESMTSDFEFIRHGGGHEPPREDDATEAMVRAIRNLTIKKGSSSLIKVEMT